MADCAWIVLSSPNIHAQSLKLSHESKSAPALVPPPPPRTPPPSPFLGKIVDTVICGANLGTRSCDVFRQFEETAHLLADCVALCFSELPL